MHCVERLEEIEAGGPGSLLEAWEALMPRDPAATFFQSPLWCRNWYQCYAEVYSPRLLCVRQDDALVGMVPLAVEQSSGALVFAGNEWSDYRDVVALPGHRGVVLAELLGYCTRHGLSRPLHIGPTQPHSDTADLLSNLLQQASGIYGIRYSSPTWWVDLGDENAIRQITRKQSVRRNVNYYRRSGDLSFQPGVGLDEWRRIREEFFDHHSLRQVVTGRVLSFADPRKQAFYDALHRAGGAAKVCVLRVDDRIIAAHYGYEWNGVLHWGAPVFDILEERHSPGQVLLAMLIEESQKAGVAGIDLTLGTEPFKERFSTARVELPSVTLYGRTDLYWRQRTRDAAARGIKSALLRIGGEQAAARTAAVKERVAAGIDRTRALRPTVPEIAGWIRRQLGERHRTLVYRASDVHLCGDPDPAMVPGHEIRRNQLRDLLRVDDSAGKLDADRRHSIMAAPERIAAGQALHTLLVDSRLAAWGWSHRLEEGEHLPQSAFPVEDQSNSVLISSCHVVREFEERWVRKAWLRAVAREWFSAGAAWVYASCREGHPTARNGIEAVGFRPVEIHEFSRHLWRERRRRIIAESLSPARTHTGISAL